MKSVKEYRALAWNELREQFSQALMIVLAVALLGLIAGCACVGAAVWVVSDPSVLSFSILAAVIIAMMLTVNVLNYYQPVWFLRLLRREEEPWYKVNTGYGRALGVAMLLLLPNIVSQIPNSMSQVMQHMQGANLGLLLGFGLMVMALSVVSIVFTFWWSYAVNAVLPFRVYDHEDRSVSTSLKEGIKMMDGYKWNLFCVDFMIILWPLIVIIVLAFGFGIIVGLEAAQLVGHGAFIGSMVFLGSIGVLWFLAMVFVIQPMLHFAHAIYYEDLCAEKAMLEAMSEGVNE